MEGQWKKGKLILPESKKNWINTTQELTKHIKCSRQLVTNPSYVPVAKQQCQGKNQKD